MKNVLILFLVFVPVSGFASNQCFDAIQKAVVTQVEKDISAKGETLVDVDVQSIVISAAQESLFRVFTYKVRAETVSEKGDSKIERIGLYKVIFRETSASFTDCAAIEPDVELIEETTDPSQIEEARMQIHRLKSLPGKEK